MADEAQSERQRASISEDEVLELLYEHASPNPERLGCPGREVLEALARRERPIGDPLYDHLAHCSPCFNEARAIQRANVVPAERSPRATAWLAIAAALVLVTGLGVWMRLAPPQAPIDLTVDLRDYAVSRSEQQTAVRQPIGLPRARVNLTLLLPTGYEPGDYEVRVVASNDDALAAGSGHAELSDFVTRLGVVLSLREVPAGLYRLAVRAEPGSWLYIPLRID